MDSLATATATATASNAAAVVAAGLDRWSLPSPLSRFTWVSRTSSVSWAISFAGALSAVGVKTGVWGPGYGGRLGH